MSNVKVWFMNKTEYALGEELGSKVKLNLVNSRVKS